MFEYFFTPFPRCKSHLSGARSWSQRLHSERSWAAEVRKDGKVLRTLGRRNAGLGRTWGENWACHVDMLISSSWLMKIAPGLKLPDGIANWFINRSIVKGYQPNRYMMYMMIDGIPKGSLNFHLKRTLLSSTSWWLEIYPLSSLNLLCWVWGPRER